MASSKRKKRTLTEEEKQIRIERLKKAREAKGQPKYDNFHPDVIKLPSDHPKSLDNVRKWIKTQRELLSEAKKEARLNIKGAVARVASHEAYIRHCQWYLKHGDWIDDFWGEYQQNKVNWTYK